ncbi:30S ribosomal protein S9 [Patescibacteria group bacterium]|nr:30S ribosomal protein S9 [Patescibacteria group bacterium]MBU1755138.1 30S ribosomal protein S9 [Patescibacteria group bacterium]
MPEKTAPYIAAIGRRKTASARVRITPADTNTIEVNGVPAAEYFKTKERAAITQDALGLEDVTATYNVTVKVRGGGVTAQAEAIRMGIARALTSADATLRGTLKAAGYLKRDPRAVERKKPGLLKARKRPQWTKR